MQFENEQGVTYLHFEVSDSFTNDVKTESIHINEAGLPWPELLSRYIEFLEEFYGYPIAQDVALRRNPARLRSTWRGEFFGHATDQEIDMARLLEEGLDNYGGTDNE